MRYILLKELHAGSIDLSHTFFKEIDTDSFSSSIIRKSFFTDHYTQEGFIASESVFPLQGFFFLTQAHCVEPFFLPFIMMFLLSDVKHS